MGKSTIDYAIISMELYPNIVDFYVDVFDKCMSDVHCPICLAISYNDEVVGEIVNDCIDNSKYTVSKNVKCIWKKLKNSKHI